MRSILLALVLAGLGLANARAELLIGPSYIADVQLPLGPRPAQGGLSEAEMHVLEQLLVASARYVDVEVLILFESADRTPSVQLQAFSEALRHAAKTQGLRILSWKLDVHAVEGWVAPGAIKVLLFGEKPGTPGDPRTLLAQWLQHPERVARWTSATQRQAALEQIASLTLCEDRERDELSRCKSRPALLRQTLARHRGDLTGSTLERLQARWQAWARQPWPAELPALVPSSGMGYQTIARAALCRYDAAGAEAALRALSDWRVLQQAPALEQHEWWLCAAGSPLTEPMQKLQRAGLDIRRLAPVDAETPLPLIGLLNRAVEQRNAGPRAVQRLLQANASVDQPGIELPLLLAAATRTGAMVCPPARGIEEAAYQERYALLRDAGAAQHGRDRFGRSAAQMHEALMCREFQRCRPGRSPTDYY